MWVIFPCPRCQSLLHRDMHECPRCRQFDLEKMRNQQTVPGWVNHVTLWPAPQSEKEELSKEDVRCPECREVMRRGLVRCWNCKSFLPPFRKE